MLTNVAVMVVAPSPPLRAELSAMIRAASAAGNITLAISGEAASLVTLGAPLPADPVVLSADSAGLSALKPAQARRLALLMMSDDPQTAPALAALSFRAWGVLGWGCSPTALAAALVALSQGLCVVGPTQLARLGRSMVSAPVSLAAPIDLSAPVDFVAVDRPVVEALTGRENQTLQLLAQGLANKQIALVLGISEHTVKFHVASVYSKLGAASRTEAVRIGVQHGLVML